MRLLGKLADQHDAATLVDYLLTQGIGSKAERNGDGWELWVHDEDRVADARREFADFQAEPQAERYRAAPKEADRLRRESADKAIAAQRNTIRLGMPATVSSQGRRPITMALFAVSAMVFIFTDFGEKRDALRWLQMTDIDWTGGTYRIGLPEIREGEWWRLLTPMFLHFGLMHFIMNMLGLFDFGTQIEIRRGRATMLGLTIVTSLACNLGEYWWSGPAFGGMSGVIFGLFGYLWMKARFEPWSGFYLRPQTVFMMIAWFFLCTTGWLGPVANAGHLFGLAAGMAWGFAPTLIGRRRPPPAG